MSRTSPVDHPLITTFGRLVEAYSALGQQLGRSLERSCGIPLSWLEVLLRIARSDGGQLSMGALAQQVALTSGGVTRLIDRMIDAGYVQRVPCPSDRRVQFAGLTTQGAAKLEAAAAVHLSNLEEVFQGFSSQDRRLLDGLLDRLRAAAGGS